MQWSTVMIALCAFSTQIFGAAIDTRVEKLPFPISTPSWEVEVTPGGEKVTLHGTVQEVHAELLKLNPNYDNDFLIIHREGSSSLNRRDFKYEDYSCWLGSDSFKRDKDPNEELKDGIDYLRGVSGTPKEDPRSCGRVSCSYSTAIYWCNYNDETHYLKSFSTIADGAEFLLDKCSPWGLVTTPDNWGVSVESDTC